MSGLKKCEYGPPEWDPRGFWFARCPKHPQTLQVSLVDPNMVLYHLVVDDDSEVSP